MPASLGDLMVGLGIDFSGMNEGATEIESRLESMGTRLYFIGSRIGAAFSAPLAGAMTAIGEFGMAFDSAMTQSLAILNDVTPQIRANMEEQARAVSETTKFSSTEAAKAYYDLASAGLDASQAIQSLPIVAKFAQAGLMDMSAATNTLAGAMTGLGMKTGDATEDARTMARIGDVLTEVNNRALGTVSDFSAALTRSAATMKQYNIPVEEGVAILGAYADQNIKGADAGTKLFMVIRDMTNAAIKHKAAWDQAFGPNSVFDDQGHLNNFADILDTVTQKFSGLSDEGKRSEIAFLGLTSRSQQALLPLLGMGDRVRELTTSLQDSGGAMDNVANKQMKSFENQLQVIQNRFDNLKSVLFDSFKPALAELMSDLNGIVDQLKPMVNWVASWTTEQKKLFVEVMIFLGGLGTVIVMLGGLVLAFSALSTICASVGVAFAFVSTNLGAILSLTTPLATAVLVVAAAFAGWEVGSWLDSWIPMSDWVQDMTMRLEGMTKAERDAAFAFQNLPKNMPGSPAAWNVTPQQTLSMWSDPISGPGLGSSTGTGGGDKTPSKEDIKNLEAWTKAVQDLAPILNSDMWDGTVQSMLKLGGSVKDVSVYFGMFEGDVKNVNATLKEYAKILEIEASRGARVAYDDLTKLGTAIPQKFFSDLDKAVDRMKDMESGTAMTSREFQNMGQAAKPVMDDLNATFGTMDLNWTAIEKSSISGLTNTARIATDTYKYMDDHHEAFTWAVRQRQKLAMDEAVAAADGTRTAWNKTFALMDLGKQILGDVGGKWGEMGAIAIDTFKNVAGALVKGDIFGAVVAGISGAITAIKALFGGPSKDELAARDTWAKFEQSLGTSNLPDTLAKIVKAYEASGRSAQEAAADMQKALDATHISAAAEKDAIDQINQKMLDGKNILADQAAAEGRLTSDILARVAAGIKSQNDYNVVAMSTVAIFGEMVQKNGDIVAAVTALKPAIDGLKASEKELGIGANAAIKQLEDVSGVVTANKSIYDAISANVALMKDLDAAQLMTKQSAEAFGKDTTEQFRNLIAKGIDSNVVLATMQPILQTLWEQQQKFGSYTDESTNNLLELAKQQNLVGPQMEDVNKQLLNVLTEIRDMFKEMTGGAESFAQALNHIPSSIQMPTVTGSSPDLVHSIMTANGNTSSVSKSALLDQWYALPDTFRMSTTFDDWSASQLPQMADGGILTGRRAIVAGEAGPEAVIPLDRLSDMLRGTSSNGESGNLTVQLMLDGRMITQAVLKNMPTELRRNGLFT